MNVYIIEQTQTGHLYRLTELDTGAWKYEHYQEGRTPVIKIIPREQAKSLIGYAGIAEPVIQLHERR